MTADTEYKANDGRVFSSAEQAAKVFEQELAESRLAWTNQKPKTTGKFWWRESSDSPREKWCIVNLEWRTGGILVCDARPVEHCTGQFAGPIPEPA